MLEKNQFYEWDQLEYYVRRRLEGHQDEAFEQQVQANDFLQTIVEGLEQSLTENPERSVDEWMEEKKNMVWKKLALATPQLMSASPSKPPLSFFQQIQAAWEDLQQAQFQYLLGFNCSCIALLLLCCLWINYSQPMEEVFLISQVEFPEGFKP